MYVAIVVIANVQETSFEALKTNMENIVSDIKEDGGSVFDARLSQLKDEGVVMNLEEV